MGVRLFAPRVSPEGGEGSPSGHRAGREAAALLLLAAACYLALALASLNLDESGAAADTGNWMGPVGLLAGPCACGRVWGGGLAAASRAAADGGALISPPGSSAARAAALRRSVVGDHRLVAHACGVPGHALRREPARRRQCGAFFRRDHGSALFDPGVFLGGRHLCRAAAHRAQRVLLHRVVRARLGAGTAFSGWVPGAARPRPRGLAGGASGTAAGARGRRGAGGGSTGRTLTAAERNAGPGQRWIRPLVAA